MWRLTLRLFICGQLIVALGLNTTWTCDPTLVCILFIYLFFCFPILVLGRGANFSTLTDTNTTQF